VLVVTDQHDLIAEQVPGAGSPTEGIDGVPRQLPPPTADGGTRRTTPAAAQQGKAHVLHLVEMK
jgi:hypothetical protein